MKDSLVKNVGGKVTLGIGLVGCVSGSEMDTSSEVNAMPGWVDRRSKVNF